MVTEIPVSISSINRMLDANCLWTSDLLQGVVAHSVRVVVVVNDLKVLDGTAFASCTEVDLRLGFPSSLRVNGEVGGFVDLDTWRDTRAGLIWSQVVYECKLLGLLHGPGGFFSHTLFH